MGGDGGSIPKRVDLVKTRGFEFKRNLGGMGYLPNTQIRKSGMGDSKQNNNHNKWTTCFLSSEPLNPPIVICNKGNLYNKESIIKYLLEKKKKKNLLHIKKLSDVYNVKVSLSLNFFFLPF
ncbi:hypothetical protein FG386_001280 [Cryptosporidium ryanae]|uniref:uncharacterized protein n=1 Tax=Cryptosporidium ryanae TaxID=515981 RepID=UPI00351A2DD1|nr:hypothetical protein FG386_001280 [Cryptosporidium ryanae]